MGSQKTILKLTLTMKMEENLQFEAQIFKFSSFFAIKSHSVNIPKTTVRFRTEPFELLVALTVNSTRGDS